LPVLPLIERLAEAGLYKISTIDELHEVSAGYNLLVEVAIEQQSS
jgi:hypothetical protein